jgi:hypothetical protein
MNRTEIQMPDGHADDGVPRCRSADIAVTVRWRRDNDGSLRGHVIAENVGTRACRLEHKPRLAPLRADGTPLPVRQAVSLEFVLPGYAVLQPGERAAAPISWRSWCGAPASDRIRVSWPGGSAIARVDGPNQPECDEGASRYDVPLSSSYFRAVGSGQEP